MSSTWFIEDRILFHEAADYFTLYWLKNVIEWLCVQHVAACMYAQIV